jgi:hypothetical protein
MLWFVAPLTLVTLLIFVYRTARADRKRVAIDEPASQQTP